MKKHTRQSRLALGLRTPPQWVVARRRIRPDWNCPTPEQEQGFKLFVFSELDRRIGAEIDALAAVAQSDDAARLFDELLRSGWTPELPEPRDGREVDNAVRRFLDAEEGARLTVTIREVFEDYWDKWNRGRPSAEELAAEYVGISMSRVRTRKKRATDRRPK